MIIILFPKKEAKPNNQLALHYKFNLAVSF